MVKKKKFKAKSNMTSLGVSGFTLAIIGLILIIVQPFFGVIVSLVGLILCAVQVKKNKTKIGNWGLGLNLIGLILNVWFSVVLIKTVVAFLGQNPTFPIA